MRRILAVGAVVFCSAFVVCAPASSGVPGPSAIPVYEGNGGLFRTCTFAPHGRIRDCFIRRFLADIDKSKDPANELPRLDRRAHAAGGWVESNCHMMMHVVGRRFGREHHVTLESLQHYLPRSNDPGCSAGFGMGLVMYLAPQIHNLDAKAVVHMCLSLPTRFRSYTCIHSLGHAYMRVFHDDLSLGVQACKALPDGQAPDCAQGAYHDYWLALSGTDGATRRRGAPTSARVVCAHQIRSFVAACWYRFFLERPPKHAPTSAAAVRRLCTGLHGEQRFGCIAGASLITSADPFVQLRICSRLRAADAAGCMRGVAVQDLQYSPGAKRVALIERCSSLRAAAREACYEWLGLTLTVVTNGRFSHRGCPFLLTHAARMGCLKGAAEIDRPLVTFS